MKTSKYISSRGVRLAYGVQPWRLWEAARVGLLPSPWLKSPRVAMWSRLHVARLVQAGRLDQ